MTAKTSNRRIPQRVLSQMTNSLWGIREDMLQRMIMMAQREPLTVADMQALADRPTRALGDNLDTVIRNGVAIIPFIGPGFRYASMMTDVCGAVSYDRAAVAFRAALEDPAVTSILWEFNSPGGEVTGCADLARMVYEARGVKPIIAFVDGDASSAAYWVASACEHIVASSTATLGCLGVLGTYEDRTEADEKEGVKSFKVISSQTPNKNRDINTPEGMALVQASIDDTATVFLGDVGKHRGVHPDDVASQFGAGGVFVGIKAVRAGLADEIGTFEEVLAELSSASNSALAVVNRPPIVPANTAPSARRKAGKQGTKMTTRKLRSAIARHSSTIAARRAAEDQLPVARRSRRASEDELAEDELAEDELAEDELPVARRSKRGASRRGASRRASEDELAEDELAEDELAEDEYAEDELPVARRGARRGASRRASDDEFAEDELAEDELAEDELAEDELAEDELPVARRGASRGARRGARRADDELAEDELAEDELAEDELAEDDLPVARRSRRGARSGSRGAYSARGRIAAILDSNSAVGRSTLAKHLALDTNLSPRQAFAILQASPRTASRAPAARKGEDFRDRMRAVGNPRISNSRGGGQGGEDDIVAQTVALGQRLGMSSIPQKGK